MGYNRRYSRRRSKNSFGSVVSDTVAIATKFGPRGTLIAGCVGFAFFYYVLPWAIVSWAGHNKAKMVGQNAAIFGKLLDDIFLRRFIHPSEWAGIAILLICIAVACCKAITRTDLDQSGQRSLTGLGKLLARLFD
jgi:hypothetical protein